MARRRNHGRKPKPAPQHNPQGLLQEIPQSMFDALVKRLDTLTDCWLRKWPDGINPRSLLEKRHGHLIRAYGAGVRAKSLYDAMAEEADWLDRNGGCCQGAADE